VDHKERKLISMAEDQPGPFVKADASTKLALTRTLLAHDRTMLAWVRTATALIGFGFSIQQFFRIARQDTVQPDRLLGPNEFGFLMILIGLIALLLQTLQNHSAIRELRMQYPASAGFQHIPISRAQILAALIALLGLFAIIVIFFRM
jgi:putative membrane protein